MRVVIYARVSTADGRQDVEVQLSELKAYCKLREWEIITEFADTISGKSSKRPHLDAMVKLIQTGAADAVVIVRLSRLGQKSCALTDTRN